VENRVQIKALLVGYCVISTLLCVIGQPFFLNGMKRKKKNSTFHAHSIIILVCAIISYYQWTKRGYKKYLF
jgi:hypothetical protein